MRNVVLIALIALFVVANGMAVAQPEIQVVTNGGPGEYVIQRDVQFVTQEYELPDAPLEACANLRALLLAMVAPDGGTCKTIEGKRNGRPVPIVAVTATAEMQESVATLLQGLNGLDEFKFMPSMKTEFYQPRWRKAGDLEPLLSKSGVGVHQIDGTSNVLVIIEDPTFISVPMAELAALDVPQRGIVVSLLVFETRKSAGKNLGVYWNAWKESLPTKVDASYGWAKAEGLAKAVTNLPNGGGQQTDREGEQTEESGWEVNLAGISPRALADFVNFLERDGFGRVTQNTKVAVLNGEPAQFTSGTKIPFRVTREGETKVEESFSGLQLDLEATIAGEANLLQVNGEFSSLVGFNDGIPVLNSSSVRSRVNLSTAKAFEITGLKRIEEASGRTGLPGTEKMGRVPLLRRLISRETSAREEWDVRIICRVEALVEASR